MPTGCHVPFSRQTFHPTATLSCGAAVHDRLACLGELARPAETRELAAREDDLIWVDCATPERHISESDTHMPHGNMQ